MRKLLAATCLLFCCLSASASDRVADDAAIRGLIEDFRLAIIEKDREKFLGLFLHEGVTWQSVLSDARLEREQREDESVRKVVVDPTQSPATFIDGIARDPRHYEETFANVVVDSDGDIASVAFDFAYLRDGRATNVGREYWLLARTESGWRIAAVTWSRNLPVQRSSEKMENGGQGTVAKW